MKSIVKSCVLRNALVFSSFDMTERIERQIARFAPGFYDRVLFRRASSAAELESKNTNLIGGAITGGANDLWQLVRTTDLERRAISHTDQRHVPLLFLNSSRRGCTRVVRVSSGECGSKIFARFCILTS